MAPTVTTCMSGVNSSRCHGKINSTSRKSVVTTTSSQSPPTEMMQEVSNNCQSKCCKQRCCKQTPCFSHAFTHGLSCFNFSYHQVHRTANKALPIITSSINCINKPTTRVCKHVTVSELCRTKNKKIKLNKNPSEVPKKSKKCLNPCSSSKIDDYADGKNNSKPVSKKVINHQVHHLQCNGNTSNPKSALHVRSRRKRSGILPAMAAAATTTAWVNTLIMGCFIMQELFLVCPPCHARSTTVINAGNPDAKRLYDDLLSNYNKLVRPVVNTTDALQVMIKLKLSQLIDVVSNQC